MAPTNRTVSEIVQGKDFQKTEQVAKAAREVKEVPDADLYLSASLGSLNDGPLIRNEAWLANMELKRRAGDAQERHERKLMWIATTVAFVGAVFGAVVGAFLTYYLSSH